MIVMPLLIVSFFFLQLDRGNMGYATPTLRRCPCEVDVSPASNALTDNFLKDIHIVRQKHRRSCKRHC